MLKLIGAIALFLLAFSVASAQVIGPARGGTGTSSIPQSGYVLVGQSNGTYAPQPTSTLGITAATAVSSVGLLVPTGFTASGSPVTSAGSLELLFSAGYGPLKTASSSEWHSFYTTPSSRITAGTGIDWSGNTLQGTLGDFSSSDLSEGTNLYFTQPRARQAVSETIAGIDYDNASGVLSLTSGYTIPTTTRLTQHDAAYGWGNHASAGYLTTFSELDPVFAASDVAGVTAGDISNWNTAYGWGNHASAGYLTAIATTSVRGMFSETVTGLTYTSSTGGLSLDTGYVIPTTTRALNWDTAYGWGDWSAQGFITDGNTGWDNTYGLLTEVSTSTVRGMFSETVPGLTYTSSTGVISLDSGSAIPTTTRLEQHDQAYAWGNHALAGYITDGNTGWDNSYGLLTTVDISANTNLTVTATGLTLSSDAIALSAGYSIPLTASTTNWQTAYGWGNHASAGYDQVTTAGDGLTRTLNDFDCDTASGTTFGCLTSANWTTFNNKQDVITAGDGLTLTGTDIDFDGGAQPAGDFFGTWTDPQVLDNSHNHTSTTLSGIDISADTNLTGGSGLTITGDDMACDTASGSVFGCLLAADWSTFNGKVSSSSIDTLAELETLMSGTNIIESAEIDTLGEIQTLVGGQNILLETEIDGCSELAALLDSETGGCNGTSGPVFPDSPTLSGIVTLANYTATNGTTTNASSTNFFSALGRFTNLSSTYGSSTNHTFLGKVFDVTNATGTSGQVLTSTGTSTVWATPSAGGTFKGTRLTKSGAQSIGTTLTVLTFDTEAFDTDAMHDAGANTRITFTTAGYYHVMGAVQTDTNAISRVQVRLDGTTTINAMASGNAGASTQNGTQVSFIYYFTAGQYIELLGDLGTTANTNSGVAGPFFSAYKVD